MVEITADLLATMAGAGAYDRGYAYFLDGRVTAIETNAGRTAATVCGTQLYQVELRHTDSRLDGACTCPASEGFDFCKHCVAVALVLRDCQIAGALPQPDDEAATLTAYLAGQSRDELVAELVDILPRVPEIRERLLAQAELAAGPISAKSLKQAITKVTRPRDLWEYGEVAAYFRRIESTLENIANIAEQVPAEALLKTALYGIERLNRALGRVDDSGGFRFAAQQILRELHSRALQRLEWPAARRANHLLELALADEWDQFEGVPHAYTEALGETGLEAFYAGVESRLAALPDLPPDADFAAVEVQRHIFERSIDYPEYRRLVEFATHSGCEASVKEAAMALLQTGVPDQWWRDEQYAYTLAQVLRDEQDWHGLQNVAVRRIRDADRLLDAARWLAKPAPGEASPVYAQAIARLIDKKKKRSYQAAVKVLLEAKPMFDAISADAFHEHVAQLKEDHRRKRSFIAVLDSAIPLGKSIS